MQRDSGKCLGAIIVALGWFCPAMAAEYRPPRAWNETVGNPAGPWSAMQVWPDDAGDARHYLPLTWRGGFWGATNNTHGTEFPSLTAVADGTVRIMTRGAWGGKPGRKTCGLVFTAPETGVYRVQGEAHLQRSGGGSAWAQVVALPPPSAPDAPAQTNKGRAAFGFGFHLKNAPRPTPFDREVFLTAGERLAFVPGMPDNNQGELRLTGLRCTLTPAGAPPADFVDAVKPLPPPPPATDETPPRIVVEGEQRVYPADAGVTDVTRPPYNAQGDGRHDDTAAIQRALNEGRIVYLPNGVYLVSEQLRFPRRAKVPSRMTFVGQSVKGTIVKLRDRTMDFGEPREPLAVIWTSHFPPQAFRIYVRNLTIDTGRGNPGAIGCQFYANNVGAIEEVTIRSGDGRGHIGLDLGHESDQGPMLARNILVEGFDTGIRTAWQTTVTTLEHISVRGQRVAGWRNDLHAIAVRDFTSSNDCPALVSSDPGAHVALIEAHLVGTGPAAAAGAAIDNEGGMFLRDVRTSGYALAVTNRAAAFGATPGGVRGPAIDEWTSHPALTLFPDTPRRSLRLPVRETPPLHWGHANAWVSVKAFGAAVRPTGQVARGKPVTYEDWSGALSNALAAGKATVYFPCGQYHVSGAFVVPPSVTSIVGCESTFVHGLPPTVFEIGEGDQPLVFADWDWMYSNVEIRHTGKRTVVIRNVSGSRYRPAPGAGDVFIDDNSQGAMVFAKGQRAWLRQCNPEYSEQPHILNDGADLWILGLKTEGYSSIVATRNGGRTELIGGSIYANEGREAEPAFINLEGTALSASVAEWTLRSCNFFEWVVAQRGDDMRVLRDRDVPMRGVNPDARPLGGYGTSAMLPLVRVDAPAQRDAPPAARAKEVQP